MTMDNGLDADITASRDETIKATRRARDLEDILRDISKTGSIVRKNDVWYRERVERILRESRRFID